jgi:hypothetical protein
VAFDEKSKIERPEYFKPKSVIEIDNEDDFYSSDESDADHLN